MRRFRPGPVETVLQWYTDRLFLPDLPLSFCPDAPAYLTPWPLHSLSWDRYGKQYRPLPVHGPRSHFAYPASSGIKWKIFLHQYHILTL